MNMQKRKDLTLADKVRVLEALSQKKSQTSLAAEFGVSQSQISRIGKNRDLIMARYLQTDNSDRKRNRDGKNVDVETALLRWYGQSQASSAPLSGPILMDKANELAVKLDARDFIPTTDWLQGWKDRHKVGLRRSEVNCESDADCVETWVNQMLPGILKEFHPDNIYCCKETLLYYKTLPQSDSTDSSNPRMTVLLCCNMSGKDRMVPYIIGVRKEYEKSVMPPCIVNSDNALMTSHLFTRWLLDLDKTLEREDRTICLVLERCVVHAIDFPLNNIKWYYTPASKVFQLHPLSLGIVRNFKCHYRRELLTVFGLLQGNINTTTSENFFHNFNMTAAVGLIGDAWRKVTSSTIVTCFSMAMFTSEEVDPAGVEYITAPENMTEEQFSAYVDIDSQLPCFEEPEYLDTLPILSWNEYEHPHKAASPIASLADSDRTLYARPAKAIKLDTDSKPSIRASLLQEVTETRLSNGVEKSLKRHQEETTPTSDAVPSASEALEACRVLRQFLEHHGVEDFSPFYEIDLQVRSVMAAAKRLKLRSNHSLKS
ncbi:tigger transposable element-derived protein 3-like [Haliotis cracherodii]|uniref:tigger transposable element-derived protein 3-like n=1 Tax=Haliotis cracherodii TaxID=6455 RepID=UPI0039E79F58